MKKILIVISVLCLLSAFAESNQPIDKMPSERIGQLKREMAEQSTRMQAQLRDSAIKINTDLELRTRANEIARQETESKFNCIIVEAAVDKSRTLRWKPNTGKSVIFLSEEFSGNYVKFGVSGAVELIGAYEDFEELLYREKITDPILEKVKSDLAEVAAAQKRAAEKYDRMTRRMRK